MVVTIKDNGTKYRPKGSMCWACANLNKDCSQLPFHTMKVIKFDKCGTKVVKCNEYIRVQPTLGQTDRG